MKKLIWILPMALLLAGCPKSHDEVGVDLIHNSQTMDGKGNGEKLPVITFDQDTHDFGRLTAGESI